METHTESISSHIRGGMREDDEVGKERAVEEIRNNIEALFVDLERAINPDFRMAITSQVKEALDDLEKVAGSRAVENYYRRLNRAMESIEVEELPREVIVEGKKRVEAFTTAEKMLDRLEGLKDFQAREDLVEEIDKFLNKNEEIIARRDNSGVKDVENLRRRLDNLRPKRESLAA